MPNLLRLWTGPLPKEELFPDHKINPLLHWFIHPVKRHIAKYYLFILQKFFGLKVIGITGSVGKTITKNMLQSILPNSKATTDDTTSTYNIPTTILKTSPFTKYLILEMSIEYIGDMDFYTWLARPDIAIITPINLTHTQFLGDIQTITSEKYKITKYAQHVITYEDVKPGNFKLPENLVGSHLQTNAALAAATAKLFGITPDFEHFQTPKHRMQLVKLNSGSLLIDDTYNANPLATREALKTLIALSKKHQKTPVFIFGQMNELGRYETSAHQEIGLLVKKLGIKDFYCLGPATKYSIESAGYGEYFTDLKSLTASVQKLKIKNLKLVILIKSSHSWHLEELVSSLFPQSPFSNY